LSNTRVSPTGDAIAFIDHPVRHDDAGDLKTVDLAGNVHTLSAGWVSSAGLAWRSRNEIWFTATKDAAPRSLWSVTAEGKARVVGQTPGILTLRDIAPDGAALFTLETRRLEMAGQLAGETGEHDFSLTDWSRVQQISGDASLMLFDESGEGSGGRSVTYLRRTRNGDVARLGMALHKACRRMGPRHFCWPKIEPS